VLQRVAVCCSALQLDVALMTKSGSLMAAAAGVLQCVAVCCSVVRFVAVCCNVLQCVAVCLGACVLQCVAVLQCFAVCLGSKLTLAEFLTSADYQWRLAQADILQSHLAPHASM